MGHATEAANEQVTAHHTESAGSAQHAAGGQGLDLYLEGNSSADYHRETWRRRFYSSPAAVEQRLGGFFFDPLQAK